MKISDFANDRRGHRPLHLELEPPGPRFEAARDNILERWPDVVPDVTDRDRLAILKRVVNSHARDDWTGVKRRDVLVAARVAFEPKQLKANRLAPLRHFLVEQAEITPLPSLVRTMFTVYLTAYSPGDPITRSLSIALSANASRLSLAQRRLVATVPELLDPADAPARLAERLQGEEDASAVLSGWGFRDLYGRGLMDHLDRAMIERFRPSLMQEQDSALERFLRWLRPDGLAARELNAGLAIDAALTPWIHDGPQAAYQKQLVQGLIGAYGDPRLQDGAAWSRASKQSRDVMIRWLTGETMAIFLKAISKTNGEAMWKPRRKFWMELYKAGHIDGAWVAFSEEAHRAALRMARTKEDRRTYATFGRQVARGSRSNTSLLIMKVGSRTVVEGSHSYKVHVFERRNPRRPELYASRYDCEKIRRSSDDAKAHHVDLWQGWVRAKLL